MKKYFVILFCILMFSCSDLLDIMNQQHTAPELITKPVTEISLFGAKVSTQVTDTDAELIDEAGFYLGFESDTSSSNDLKILYEKSDNERYIPWDFSCQVSDLDSNTTYRVKAYAFSIMTGCGYGNYVAFTTMSNVIKGKWSFYDTYSRGYEVFTFNKDLSFILEELDSNLQITFTSPGTYDLSPDSIFLNHDRRTGERSHSYTLTDTILNIDNIPYIKQNE
ncbi:MAG: hypothetical protein K9N05_02425 [Candidatus Marinimicrobia bacterium]|nr:hypothetical protein [Candidatus Neomarinimicrobiota bacterium]